MRSGIGDQLRAARRARARTLTDAAHATHVRESYLAALEEEDFAALGSEVYARGFLRAYARYLELDPEPLLEAYRASLAEQEQRRGRPARTGPAPRSAEPSRPPMERPAGTAVLLLLVLIVLLVIAYVGLAGGGAEALPALDPRAGGLP